MSSDETPYQDDTPPSLSGRRDDKAILHCAHCGATLTRELDVENFESPVVWPLNGYCPAPVGTVIQYNNDCLDNFFCLRAHAGVRRALDFVQQRDNGRKRTFCAIVHPSDVVNVEWDCTSGASCCGLVGLRRCQECGFVVQECGEFTSLVVQECGEVTSLVDQECGEFASLVVQECGEFASSVKSLFSHFHSPGGLVI